MSMSYFSFFLALGMVLIAHSSHQLGSDRLKRKHTLKHYPSSEVEVGKQGFYCAEVFPWVPRVPNTVRTKIKKLNGILFNCYK